MYLRKFDELTAQMERATSPLKLLKLRRKRIALFDEFLNKAPEITKRSIKGAASTRPAHARRDPEVNALIKKLQAAAADLESRGVLALLAVHQRRKL